MKLLMRARELGFLSETELARCLDLMSEAEKAGRPRRLAQILLEGNMISSGELLVALKGAPGSTPIPPSKGGVAMTESAVMSELQRRSKEGKLVLKPGSVLGNYELVREVARGGMGVLFEGRRRAGVVGERVAIKVLSARASTSKTVLERFRQEAGLAAALVHPNIIKIHDIAQDRGYHFIVMDFFEGRSLADLLKAGTLAPKKAIQVCATIGHALGYMHEHQVVHRDIKPGNIMVGAGGKVCLTDFGLAKDMARTDIQLTQLGVAVGTPAYMSPEQARGEQKAIGPASDVYSLAATLYRALSGVYVYDAPSYIAAVKRIIHEEPMPLRKYRPDCPAELEAIILRAMSRDPAARPGADDFGFELERFLEEEDLLMPPPPANPKA
jgi:serine/threonine-protein kinase